jgi:outer membrane protein OmpA-like peptidoglycan-associated protein
LENIAAALQDVQQVWNRNFILVVRGHTDSRPPKRFLLYRDNLELSELRARAVEKSLAASGIRPPQFQIVAQGMGDTEPHVANCRSGALIHCLSPDDYRSSGDLERNRRIELRFGVFSGNGAETAPEADQ